MCASSSADLKSKLAGLTKGAEIVLVGTTLYNNADAGLDTTAIGGTNYSTYGAEWQPQGYAAIGISGANAGSAYESYYLASDVGKAYMQDPFANGLLAVDQHSNFNFHAGNNMQFQVFPNDPTFTNSALLDSGVDLTPEHLGFGLAAAPGVSERLLAPHSGSRDVAAHRSEQPGFLPRRLPPLLRAVLPNGQHGLDCGVAGSRQPR